jgi:hypothetical protein
VRLVASQKEISLNVTVINDAFYVHDVLYLIICVNIFFPQADMIYMTKLRPQDTRKEYLNSDRNISEASLPPARASFPLAMM